MSGCCELSKTGSDVNSLTEDPPTLTEECPSTTPTVTEVDLPPPYREIDSSSEQAISTRNNYSYEILHKDFSNRTSISFTVRTRNDAYLTLQAGDAASKAADEHGFEIVIGAWDNARSEIRSSFQRNLLASAMGRYLSSEEDREFWVSWSNARIRVGKRSGDSFMEVDMIRTAGISTREHAVGVWVVELGGGEQKGLFTLNSQHTYQPIGVNLIGRTSLSFAVQARSDAYLKLQATDDPGDPAGYEVLLGCKSNTISKIVFGKSQTVLAAAQGSHLDENTLRSFWVSWADNKIKVGSGRDVSEDKKFLEAPLIRLVGIASGWGVPGEWRIND